MGDLSRRYLDAEKLKQVLQEPELVQLYQELEAEDLALAEAGLAAYDEKLRDADQS
ncbi:MAG: hypothetical protein JNM56_20810 [Planctomycetia bacterium]|nr:hypothetical protein [Planctomycetia bacterium]